jgi:hypothetical protein
MIKNKIITWYKDSKNLLGKIKNVINPEVPGRLCPLLSEDCLKINCNWWDNEKKCLLCFHWLKNTDQ